jgi:hypothetical protein
MKVAHVRVASGGDDDTRPPEAIRGGAAARGVCGLPGGGCHGPGGSAVAR